MKNRNRIAAITVVLGILSLVCLFGYYLALHDIFHDYASPRVLQEQAKIAPETLPDWTACPLEWRVVGIGFWLMLVFHIAFLTNVVWHAKSRNDRMPNQALETTS